MHQYFRNKTVCLMCIIGVVVTAQCFSGCAVHPGEEPGPTATVVPSESQAEVVPTEEPATVSEFADGATGNETYYAMRGSKLNAYLYVYGKEIYHGDCASAERTMWGWVLKGMNGVVWTVQGENLVLAVSVEAE